MIRLLLSILTCYCLSATAQQNNEFLFRHIDQRDGLLHNSIFSITQDSKGFMWISTFNGLQRYDGLRFKNYEKELKKFSYTIPIKNIYEDKEKNIWVSGSQVACINTVKNTAISYNKSGSLKDPEEKFVIYTDERNNKWMLSNYSLYYQDSPTGQMKLFAHYTPKSSSTLGNLIYHDSLRNCTWVTKFHELMMLDERTRRIYTTTYNPLGNPVLKAFANKSVSFILIGSNGNIWAAEWGSSIYKYNAKLKNCRVYQTVQKVSSNKTSLKLRETITTLCMYEDSHGSIWIGNDHGLYRYEPVDDDLKIISDKVNGQKGLQYNYYFLCISEDRDGNIWLGTDKGIDIFNPYNQYFYSIVHEDNNASLPRNEITSIMQTGNRSLYIGTWGGGFSIYDSLGHFKKTVSPKGPYEYPLIWSLAENDDGKVWAGAQHGYLHIYDPVSGTYTTIHPQQLENSTIRCMIKDRFGNMWLGLHNGKIVEWEKHSSRFIVQSHGTVPNSFPVKNVFIGKNNTFWVSTENGLLRFDPDTHQFITHYLISKNNLYADCSDDINGAEQQNDSTLIVGTMRCGFFFFNTLSNKFTRYNDFSDLTATNIFAIKKDVENNLWMTSDYHIYQLRGNDGKLLKYDVSEGLMNSSFEMLNIYPIQHGNWLTASKTEAIIFNPEKMSSVQKRYKAVVITGFKIFDKEMNVDSILYQNKTMQLQSDQNFITIEFTTQSYAGIAKNIFYKLSGIDKNWVKAKDNGVASYTNLAPGDYHFQIRAGEEDTPAPVTTLNISITPPFYYTWWFKALMVLAAVLIIYFFVKRRIQNIRYKAEIRHKVSETEVLALRSQMNPHFIFNCLSAIDNLIQTNEPDKATTYLARFAKLIRSVLESTKDNLVPFYKDFETLQLYIELEQFSSGNKFTYTMHADEELMNGDYKVPPLLVQPFVENAIHHGLLNKIQGERNLALQVSLQPATILYLISDNGVGRKKAQEIKQLNKPDHNSYGIEISSQRIQLHNQNGKKNDIVITDLSCEGKPVGTEIAINIKIDNP
jgi:ligand-binding sensor domain-containing protein